MLADRLITEPDSARFRADGVLLLEGAGRAFLSSAPGKALAVAASTGPGIRVTDPGRELLAEVCGPGKLAALASLLAGEPLRPVRILIFDKTESSNWAVTWHQDRVLPLREKRILPGFTRWTSKSGIPHVEPPESLSRRMISIRVHLDDCGPANGPLSVIPGSHERGRLTDEQVEAVADRGTPVSYPACAGDILILKTLIVHASERARLTSRRRVLHIDFAPDDLPQGLDWAFKLDGVLTK
ncbi:phytanoyl-CoA dioxygenase family protein [Maricaulis salignorans]|uniref:phytanoyl-CoA dioxygenase family protein n=1 Tax=Maricaulis salignorans TaxID=144026 RepID=UPI003A9018E0